MLLSFNSIHCLYCLEIFTYFVRGVNGLDKNVGETRVRATPPCLPPLDKGRGRGGVHSRP